MTTIFPWKLVDPDGTKGEGTAGVPTGELISSVLGFTAAMSAKSSAGVTLEELLW